MSRVGSISGQNNIYQLQPDAVISQVNPVSGQWYTVLDTTRNVRIIGIADNITWAVTQPTPLDIRVTIDGNSIVFSQGNPVSGSWYYPYFDMDANEASQGQTTNMEYQAYRAFLLEGRSVKIEARITWAVTQPTPLVCRVKWAKIP